MPRRSLHLLAICCIALALRLASVALTTGSTGGMSNYFLGLSDMLSSGLGYHRVHIDLWPGYRAEMRTHSRELASVGQRLDEDSRLPAPGALVPEFYRNPGYPIFLHGVYRLFGEPLERNARVVQAVLTSISPLLVFLLAMLLFEQAAPALLAAWLVALHPALAHIDVLLLSDGFAALLVLAAAVALVAGVRSRRLGWFLLAGLAFGASGYFRSNVLYVWVFVGAALFVAMPRWKLPAVSAAIVAAAIFLALAPWAIRNHRASGEWIWGATRAGATLWESAGQFKNPWDMKLLDEAARQRAKQAGFESELTPEADAWFMDQMKQAMREDPLFFVVAAIKRVPWMLAPAYPTGYENRMRTHGMYSYYLNEKGMSPVDVLLAHPGYVIAAFWERGLVMILGALGTASLAWLALSRLRTRLWAVALLLALPLYYYAVHAPAHVTARYLTPLIPYQMIGIAFLVFDLRVWLHARRALRTDVGDGY